MTGFQVDTKLFQELGELLVAKESTALVELIKNAYDADATLVTVSGTNLSNENLGTFVVSDNGVGMIGAEFQRGFLTIAARTKNSGDRRSPVFGRRFTGEKGVGRLASHKLGRVLRIESLKAGPAERGAHSLPSPTNRVTAKIDWDAIERLETLDQVDGSGAVELAEQEITRSAGRSMSSGTQLVIAPLRKAWTERTRAAFLSEAATLAPVPATWKPLTRGIVIEPLLFDEIPIRDGQSADPGFEVVFAGELGLGDQLRAEVANAAHWIAEMAYDRETSLIRIAVSPTAAGRAEYPTAEGFRFSKHVDDDSAPSFSARILQRSGETWAPAVQGIRVFMEGFRVPPYGDPRDDWLDLERSYKSRAGRRLISLSNLDSNDLPEGLANEELVLQGNAAYMGGIFLQRSSSPGLEMLINREGFLPGPEFDFVIHWTRVATDLIVRLGALARKEVKAERAEERQRQRIVAARADVNETPTALRVRESAIAVTRGLGLVKAAIDRQDYVAAAQEAVHIQPNVSEIRDLSDQFGSEAVQWRVLASLGAELAAFVHEVNAVGMQISALARELDEALSLTSMTRIKTAIRRARQRALDLAGRISRNATYLVDATSFEGRRRRSRQPLQARLENVLLFFQTRIEQRDIDVEINIDADLRTPPMFPAELSGIFTNLLSNAVKFTDEGGKIKIEARERGEFFEVRISNTGTAVDMTTASRLFDAFRSTTERPDAILGQGMGMGLTITRAFIQEYGGEIDFVTPPDGFATAIRFRIPVR